MLEENFWQDKIKSQKIIKEKKLYEDLINSYNFTVNQLKDLEDLLAFLDAGKKNNWSLKDNKIDFVKSGNIHRMNERIPSFLLQYNTEENYEEMDLDNFFEITKEYRDEDELRHIYSYQKNKSKFTDIIKEDSIYYEDDGNTMRYEIYKNLGIFMMFLWSTNGFSIYREFDNKNDLEESFTLYTKRYLDF